MESEVSNNHLMFMRPLSSYLADETHTRRLYPKTWNGKLRLRSERAVLDIYNQELKYFQGKNRSKSIQFNSYRTI